MAGSTQVATLAPTAHGRHWAEATMPRTVGSLPDLGGETMMRHICTTRTQCRPAREPSAQERAGNPPG
eukprot:15485411-Alexandrium_andersonii.AAC.1